MTDSPLIPGARSSSPVTPGFQAAHLDSEDPQDVSKHTFGCLTCKQQDDSRASVILAKAEHILSKQFHGYQGRAFLFRFVQNVTEGRVT